MIASYIHLSSYEIVLLRSVLGFALLLVLFFATGHRITAFSHKRDLLFIALSGVAMAADWVPILLLGLVNTGLGCFCYFSSIGSLPAQPVAICGYLEPLFAVLLSVLILHETMMPLQILGAFLIIGGAVFGECRTGRKRA